MIFFKIEYYIVLKRHFSSKGARVGHLGQCHVSLIPTCLIHAAIFPSAFDRTSLPAEESGPKSGQHGSQT